MASPTDTIAALATPPGLGGVAVIRVSGPRARAIGEALSGKTLTPRLATLSAFRDDAGQSVDAGLLLYFPGPHSYTGEDVVEFQGHGGPAVAQLLLQTVLAAGARLAEAGEFTQRAFLNDKMDLAQAEAVADLIHARSFSAVRAANRSLQGDFSRRVNGLVAGLTGLRLYLEAALDFPEEEIDFLGDGQIEARLQDWLAALDELLAQSDQGQLLNEGITLVLAGRPNAGKSSLLNALLGEERAIVSPVAGTTRDLIREQLLIAGMPVQILDTAGLRASDDAIEREGVRRSRAAVAAADVVINLIDGTSFEEEPDLAGALRVYSKADLVPAEVQTAHGDGLWISAPTGRGLEELRAAVAARVGRQLDEEAPFIGRERHRQALLRARHYGEAALAQLRGARLGELVADDLRSAADALGEITGKMTADDLLGAIFSRFCIGK